MRARNMTGHTTDKDQRLFSGSSGGKDAELTRELVAGTASGMVIRNRGKMKDGRL